MVSFWAIAAKWSDHHDAFRYIRRMDSRLRWLNTLWLLAIVLIPFATKLLTEPGHQSLDVNALEYAFTRWCSRWVGDHDRHAAAHGLPRPGARHASPHADRMAWQSYALALGFGLSIPFFFVTSYAWCSGS